MSKSDSDKSKLIHKKHEITNSNRFFRSANYFCPEQGRERISTSSKHLDHLLSGGLEVGEITQFYGGPATGKSHLCHTLCVVLPSQYQAIYIDTERGFRQDKIKSIAEARGLDWNTIHQNIHLAQPKNSQEQELCIEEASSLLSRTDLNMKLLIVDSLMFHYRAAYPGRSGLSERAHRLNILMHKLRNLTQTKNIAALITNQSVSNPRNEEDEDPQPCGGKIISLLSTYIIQLKRTRIGSSYPLIKATILKSPLKGSKTHPLTIFDKGFLDIEYPTS